MSLPRKVFLRSKFYVSHLRRMARQWKRGLAENFLDGEVAMCGLVETLVSVGSVVWMVERANE